MQIREEFVDEAIAEVTHLIDHQDQYRVVSAATGIPWTVLAVIHALEADVDFSKHLHNGDPLRSRTVHVPKGRPVAAPTNGVSYTWIESAIDAVSDYHWSDWSIPGTLYLIESFNGFGYARRGINTPYLWSKTNHYTRGLYYADGKFSPTMQSVQTGAAILLKYLMCYDKTGYMPKQK